MNNKPKQPSEEILEVLKSVSLFKDHAEKPEELERIAGILETKNLSEGKAVIEEGDTGDTLFIMKKGAVNILKNTLGDEKYTVVRLESKDNMIIFFGELALLDNDKRSATVITDSDCEFLVMRRDDFIELGDKYPDLCLPITREISKILATRLRKANQDIITLFEALVGEVVDTAM